MIARRGIVYFLEIVKLEVGPDWQTKRSCQGENKVCDGEIFGLLVHFQHEIRAQIPKKMIVIDPDGECLEENCDPDQEKVVQNNIRLQVEIEEKIDY